MFIDLHNLRFRNLLYCAMCIDDHNTKKIKHEEGNEKPPHKYNSIVRTAIQSKKSSDAKDLSSDGEPTHTLWRIIRGQRTKKSGM